MKNVPYLFQRCPEWSLLEISKFRWWRRQISLVVHLSCESQEGDNEGTHKVVSSPWVNLFDSCFNSDDLFQMIHAQLFLRKVPMMILEELQLHLKGFLHLCPLHSLHQLEQQHDPLQLHEELIVNPNLKLEPISLEFPRLFLDFCLLAFQEDWSSHLKI